MLFASADAGEWSASGSAIGKPCPLTSAQEPKPASNRPIGQERNHPLNSERNQMNKHTNIKEINLAKLRILRDEFAERAKSNERKAKAIRNAEQAEITWELVKLGVKPLRAKHLCR